MRPASLRVVSLIALAAVLAALSAPSPAAAERRAKHVVLVDWDGFDADYLAALLGTRPPAQAQGRVLGEALGPAAPQGAAGR